MKKVLDDIKQQYNKRVIILTRFYFVLCSIALWLSGEGQNILGLIFAGIFLLLLVGTPMYCCIKDYRISNWKFLYVAREVCKVYWDNEQVKYDTLKFLFQEHKSELQPIRLKLKVEKETKTKLGINTVMPIILSCIAIYLGIISNFDLNQYNRAIIGYILLFIFCVVGCYLAIPSEYKNIDDYILFCIEDILEDRN
ncbi:hypothetical protein ACOAOT_08320 [Lacrimispora sp. AGF001]|uniref:hypothetical protein n=1 Tax=Lacrimispora sp. AGF001 TaxID=3401631 RepID=UPI003B43D62D|nr:hypothetical protein [Paenibacillaceae bacterium]